MNYARGALADTDHHKTLLPRYTASAGPLTPPGLQRYAFLGRDQGQTPECVGFGVSQCAAIFARSQLPSARALFTFAKVVGGQDLTNEFEGTYSTAAWTVVQQLGLVRAAAWPDAGSSSEMPDAGACESLGPQWAPHRIAGATDLRVWLGSVGRPASLVLPVDQAYDDLAPGKYWNGPTGDGGLHCQCVVDYDDQGVLLVNSWGLDWCDQGMGRVTWGAIDRWATDIIGPTNI